MISQFSILWIILNKVSFSGFQESHAPHNLNKVYYYITA